jgi:tRNA 2-thiocytidine biosynthesis protein TtcA
MIAEGDLIMVCMSGGKDSYTLLDMLLSLQRSAPVDFELVAVNLDQNQPGFPVDVLPDYLSNLGVKFHILSEDTYSVVTSLTPVGKATCPICSRLRRGILYSFAKRLGASKIALGHHLDDAVETLFLNMFFGSKLKSMPPKLLSDDGANLVIRPLYRCRERDIEAYSKDRQHPIIPCNLCGSQPNLQRAKIKKMLQGWDLEQPDRVNNIARSMENLAPSQLADAALFDFSGLRRRNLALPTIDLVSN